jgi:septal ring factor EnvC (AmiA/AmiB activator)
MQKLYETFASKNPPDNTINRIAALEKLNKELGLRLDSNEDSLNKRLALLEEKVNKNHESRIAALEADFKALKDSLSGSNMKSDEKMDVS